MTLASRFLSANSEEAVLESCKKEKGEKKQDAAAADDQPFHPSGRPGQVSVKVKKASNLPMLSGPVHRFVEVEYSGKTFYYIIFLINHGML